MRWFIGILIAVNLAILAWGWLGDDEPASGKLAAPGVGTIRLMGEPETAPEPVAVPIPAPPRDTGEMAAKEPAAAQTAKATPAPETQVSKPLPPPQEEAPAEQPASAPQTLAEAEPSAEPEAPAGPEPVVGAPEPEYVPEPGLVAPVPKRFCLRIGPFADARAAKSTRSYLAGLGEVKDHKQTAEQRVGYWVLVPPQPSRAAADAIAARLKAKGIKDYWVLSRGPVRNGISLGVFSQRENADTMLKEIRAKGFKVEMRDKTKRVEQLWLDYSGTKPVRDADVASRAPAGVRVESQSCPAAGESG